MGQNVHYDDWSLDRRGQIAKERHDTRVRDALRDRLKDVVTQEDLIMSNGKKAIRIPIKSLDEPSFRYGRNEENVGQKKGAGNKEAGNDPKDEDVLEAAVLLSDVEQELFKYFQLPIIIPKATLEPETEIDFTDLRKKGIRSNLDRKRTVMEAYKRSLLLKKPLRISDDDMRYKTWEEKEIPEVKALVIAQMDCSGSMGDEEKYCARSFFFWMERFLMLHYKTVHFRYIVHHANAKEVDKETFYNLREGGGTLISSSLALAKDMIEEYDTNEWNIYPFLVGDSDNFTMDNERVAALIEELVPFCSFVGSMWITRSLGALIKRLQIVQARLEPSFAQCVIPDRTGIFDSLSYFFHKESSLHNNRG